MVLFFVSFAAPAAVTHDYKLDELKTAATRIVLTIARFL